MSNIVALALVAALVLAGFLIGGIYEFETTPARAVAYRMNKFTGSMAICDVSSSRAGCKILPLIDPI